jgi:hypothetical protein
LGSERNLWQKNTANKDEAKWPGAHGKKVVHDNLYVFMESGWHHQVCQ